MALTKRTFIDQITLEPEYGTTFWREVTVIEENGEELSRAYHRSSAEVDDAVTQVPPAVAAHRALVDTPQARTRASARRDAALARIAQGRPA